MSSNNTPYKSRPAPGQLGSTPFRSSSANRFRSSLVPMSRPSPARASNSPTKLTKTTNKARDLFRTSTPRSQRTAEFAPDLPAAATRPPASMRKFAPRKSVSSGMSNTGSTEPFKMRIPSPDPDLTGHAIAKEVPDDPNRTGSIYADQFLAHKCPPHFDEIQRRQFFCILDLRRLKYAADEIFAKKDWKLNIVNFAKEYEKSRGLIMLRYGLYEFHNVKPSSEVLKKWRAAHGLPAESEEDRKPGLENSRTPGPATSTKRKAEEQPTPKDNTLMASTANQNKRRNLSKESDDPVLTGPAPFKQSKRKMEEEEDENKPNKQQKSTPSTATVLFESILNKPRNGAASPVKSTYQASSLFGTPKPKVAQDTKSATKASSFVSGNGNTLFGSTKTADSHTASGSVLSGHEIGSTPAANTRNIFSYLSESPSDSSGNENDNAEDRETDSEPEQDAEDQSPSTAVNASVGANATPVQNAPSLFATPKPGVASNIFGGLSKPADQHAKGGLFGRVQMDANGQPARASPGPEDKPLKASEQQAKTPAMPAGDYTFNPATTPISFGQSTLGKSKSSATTDAEAGAKPDISEFKKPAPIFGASSQASSTPKPNTSSLVGLAGSAKPKSSEESTSIFASQKPTPASTSIFGAPSSSFGAKSPFVTDEQADAAPSAAKKQAASIFDKPASCAPAASETKSTLNTTDDKDASSAAPIKRQPPSIFDKSFIKASAGQFKASSSGLESSSGLFDRQSNPLFGGDGASKDSQAGDSKTDTSTPAAKKQTPSIFDKSFIADNAAQTKTLPDSAKPSVDLFSRNSNPLFGASKPNGTDVAAGKSIFGQADKQANTDASQTKDEGAKNNKASDSGSKPSAVSIFGSQGSSNSSTPASSLFGGKKPDEATKPASSIFSAPTSTSATTSFGGKKMEETPKPAPSIFGTQTGSGLSKSTSTLFGGKKSEEPTKPAPSIFGGQANPGSTSTTTPFGEKKPGGPASSFGSAPGGNSALFSFGSQPNSGADIQSPATTFGAGPTPSASVSFGASGPQANGDKPKNMGFQFGSSAPGAGSSSFTFGQDSSAASSFTFTAGADKQPINNPFAAAQPTAQPSAPAFASKSFTATPSSSFKFSFGQPAASTPKAASQPAQGGSLFGVSANTNGAPSFSFTQASPSQNSSDNKFSKSSVMNSFGHLQASDGSIAGGSPFPAPSSIGTTPVNGTPEPQSPRDDGDEAPQEQIKLTEGGPGEEDEVMLHEVRAKVIKYIPVQKGDEDAPKSPWSTQGVGPLRVLKNKSTGTVRILLRAEPRGHIAMNKTILPDIEYAAKEKTISFVAASDDGSNLETWLLQVKKPELAKELASVLEANKSANKKREGVRRR